MKLPTIPQGLDLINAMGHQTIRKTWRSWTLLPLAIFAVVWNLFLVGLYSTMFSGDKAPLIALLFPLGHVAVGVGLTYFVIAGLFNTTDINISAAQVEVKIGPFPWRGNKTVRSSEIGEVLVRERRGNKGRVSYAVLYADRRGREQNLATGFAESDQAEYVAEMVSIITGKVAESEG
jgi:hypothetical protein